MERIQIDIPEKVLFTYTFTIAKQDINFANHMGNEMILVYANTIRPKFFEHLQLEEMDSIAQTGTIVVNHQIVYKSEGFLHDEITCAIGVCNFTSYGFDAVFHFIKKKENKTLAILKTGVVYFDYFNKRVHKLPMAYIEKFYG
ncbi:MAG: thioesterase family protein [Chitinophagales bacterium]|nr:thioesterase family protein [Chitinophagales bacterium]